MIIVTGAAGFIGSALVSRLNQEMYLDIVLVDDFKRPEKEPNYANKVYKELVDRERFFKWVRGKEKFVQFILHMGARTDTTEENDALLFKLNTEFSQKLWKMCTHHGIPFIYASSAATYGDGSKGFDDNHEIIPTLEPLNAYADSKQEFDEWALVQEEQPPFWAGLKFFNVYGPNEYHKAKMASVIFHAFNQIAETGKMKLFKSHNPNYKNGEQKRDFIYLMDVLDIIMWLMKHRKDSGIYNIGSGEARTFLDLTKAVFKNMFLKENIEFIDTPENLREHYQYFTEAKIDKLRSIGYDKKMSSLEEGIGKYVNNYLMNQKIY